MDFSSSHTAGRATFARRSSGRERPPLGALHRDAFRREFPDDQGDEGEHEGDPKDCHRLGRRAQRVEQPDQRRGKRDGRRRRGEEAGQGDADLDGCQEAVRVAGEPGQDASAPRAPLQLLDLTARSETSAISLPESAALTRIRKMTNAICVP
jgi:hypothetical protein